MRSWRKRSRTARLTALHGKKFEEDKPDGASVWKIRGDTGRSGLSSGLAGKFSTDGRTFVGKIPALTRIRAWRCDRIYTHLPPEMTGWKFHSLYPECTRRFFAVLDDFHDKIRACFFGHIHSYDRKEYRGIPLVVTGAGGAEARGLGANGYEGNRPFQAMAFDTITGEIQLLEDAQ